jgi:hypothetical protein
MKTIKELKKIKSEFKPLFPVWLLKVLSHGEYNKTVSISKFKINYQQLTIVSFVLLTIAMFISYGANDDKPTLIVWLGVVLYVVFFSCVLLMMGLITYNNIRIKKICKENDITLEFWNKL